MHKFLFYNKFIIFLYMFRALLCSSSGGQTVLIQHLVSSHSAGGRPVHRSSLSLMLKCQSTINYNFIIAMHCSKKLYIQSKCSRRWEKLSPDTCRAGLKGSIKTKLAVSCWLLTSLLRNVIKVDIYCLHVTLLYRKLHSFHCKLITYLLFIFFPKYIYF
jgi:hypothetical protein